MNSPSVLWSLLLFFPLLYMSVFLHEVGHAVVGRASWVRHRLVWSGDGSSVVGGARFAGRGFTWRGAVRFWGSRSHAPWTPVCRGSG